MRHQRISEKQVVVMLWIMPMPLKGRHQEKDSARSIIINLEVQNDKDD